MNGLLSKKLMRVILSSMLLGTCVYCHQEPADDPKDTGTVTEKRTDLPDKTDAVVVTECTSEDVYDFFVDIPAGREVTILQLSYLQLLTLDGARSDLRHLQFMGTFYPDKNVYDEYTQIWRYVDEAIERANPALIVLAGDTVYGETDDSGIHWLEICEKMDSYEIPWLVIFGNHDNESDMGVLW